MDAGEQLLTAGEAARLCGISPSRVTQLARSGAIPFTRTGVGRLYRRADVEALLARRREAAAENWRIRVPAEPVAG
jgi:excisionase family DNA binding protein